MNKFIVEQLTISGNYASWEEVDANVVMPLNIGRFLDERLDECQIVLYNDNKKEYTPNAFIRITTTTDVGTQSQEQKTFLFKVSSDFSQEFPNGSGKYKHTLGLVELTKYLEGIVCQTLTFTNVLPTQYAGNPTHPTISKNGTAPNLPSDFVIDETDTKILSPSYKGQQYTPPTSKKIDEIIASQYPAYYVVESNTYGNTRLVYNGADYLWDNTTTISVGESPIVLEYHLMLNSMPQVSLLYGEVILRFEIPTVSQLPTRKWTIADVCDRIFDLAEPLTDATETPRFVLSDTDRAELSKITAPEFTMAQSTLREQLKVVGGKIHAEPRVTSLAVFSPGKYRYTIGFDYYGKYNFVNLPTNYLLRTYSRSIDQYVTQIHTNPSNLVNSLQDKRGTVTDPGADYYRSLRTEQNNVRVTDQNGEIQTANQIYSVEKLMVGIYKTNGSTSSQLMAPVDITAYVFESAEYDSVLTDYNGNYPTSKAYALRYERGSKNISGLFYQSPNVISQALSDYSIVNILSVVSGVGKSTIQGYLNQSGASVVSQVTYKPIFNSAFTHGKSKYDSNEEPYTSIYNQSNGLVELTYYGENVKGVAERLGNAEIAVTCVYSKYSDIPNIGDSVRLASNIYAISAVTTEMTSNRIKCTLALTKDFNRISQYVGIDSRKRIEQISLSQSYDRDVIIKEYLVIGQKPAGYTRFKCIGSGVLEYFSPLFDSTYQGQDRRITQAMFGYKNAISDAKQRLVVLPVVGSGFGNVTVLSASFKDNYSAGINVKYLTGGNDVQGLWQTEVPYSDFYGRAKYVLFEMGHTLSGHLSRYYEAFDTPHADREGLTMSPILCSNSGGYNKAYLARKDSRERFSTFNYCVEAKTTIAGLNIGSGISQMNALVSNALGSGEGYTQAKVYFIPTGYEFPYKLDDTITDYPFSEWEQKPLSVIKNTSDGTFYLAPVTVPSGTYIGWVIAVPPKAVTKTVYKEDGTTESQTTYDYGNIILSKMEEIEEEDSIFGSNYTFRMEKR